MYNLRNMKKYLLNLLLKSSWLLIWIMLPFLKVAHKTKVFKNVAKNEFRSTSRAKQVHRLITFILTYYIIFLKNFTIITSPSGTNLDHRHLIGTWKLYNTKIITLYIPQIPQNLCEVVKFSIFNGKYFQFPSCSFLGLDLLGYDSVFLYMSSLRDVIPFRTWHK